ncbi:TPA: hypothetical protein ACG1QI_003599 [Enterobacter kobei]|uniref:hypothetical protein n=1 Tax=Enterobacter kobei TaxID=208224 RepID=UPI00298BE2FF|nr:hypothetical protein [Enterobacter kobei]
MPFIPLTGYLFSYLLSGYRYVLSAALWRVQPFRTLRATLKTDRAHSGALARRSTAKKIFHRPKSHYTAPACGFWIAKFFQSEFFTYDPPSPRHCWGVAPRRKLKSVKRISVFFNKKDLRRI